MSTSSASRNNSSAASSQFSSPPSPGLAAALTSWKNDSHVTVKDGDIRDNVPKDTVAGRPVLSQRPSIVEPKAPRFIEHEDGSHEHNIHDNTDRGKSSSMVYHLNEQGMLHSAAKWIKGLRKQDNTAVSKENMEDLSQSLTQKYGKCGQVLGSGAFGIVRVAHKIDESDPKSEQLFAVKQLAQRPNEPSRKYHKRVTAEFCISSALHHANIVSTLDLLQDDKDVYCQVMEYCAAGDLHTMILATSCLDEPEADCFFKQLMQGILYMHEMGIAHRDLKPENILLTPSGTIKITDFGNAECFRNAWETEAQLTQGVCGSAPYIAPEVYTQKTFDARATDVWAAGVIYMAMRTGRNLWIEAKPGKDAVYTRYVEERRTEAGYKPLEKLRRRTCRNVIYSTLDPNTTRRLTAHQVICSEWIQGVETCEAGRCSK